MFESIAYAAEGGKAGNPIGAFLPLILIFVIFYFLMIRPQQKRQKQHQQMVDAVKAGDEILLASGMYGKVDRVLDQNTFSVEIASGVKVKVSKNAIASKVNPVNPTGGEAK